MTLSVYMRREKIKIIRTAKETKTAQINKLCAVSNHRNLTNPASALTLTQWTFAAIEVNKYELASLITLEGHTCSFLLHGPRFS